MPRRLSNKKMLFFIGKVWYYFDVALSWQQRFLERMAFMKQDWKNDISSIPFGPLGVIAMPGCEEMGEKINSWLEKWHQEELDEDLYSTTGKSHSSFLINAQCPRFGTGEGKGVIKETVRGYDIYIIVDVCAHNVTYKMYGEQVPMSPDNHFQDLKRIISAIGG